MVAFAAASAWAIPVPTGLTATPSGYTVNLNWTYAANTSWVISRRTDTSGYQYLAQVYTNSYTDFNLANGTRYYYQIYAESNTTWAASGLTPEVSALIQIVVPTPQITVTRASTYQINVSWTTSSSIWFWQLQRSVNGGAYTSLGSFYSASFVDTSVANNTTYSYQVRAADTNGTFSAWSTAGSQAISVNIPAPSGLSAAGSLDQVRLTWYAVTNAYCYEIWRAASSNGSYAYLYTIYSPGSSYTDYTVVPGVLYYYKVRADDSMGTLGAFAGPVSGGDMTNAPVNNGLPESPHPYPNNLDQTWAYQGPADATALNLTFDPRAWTESGYDFITIMDGSGNLAAGPFSGTALAGRTIQVNGNAARIRLTSDYSNNGWGFALTSITPVLPPTPPAPVALKPAPGAVVSGPAALSWQPRSGAQSYQVEWSSNGVTWSTMQTAGTFYAPNLTNGTWQWRVRSINSAGLSSPGPATAFTLTAGYALSYTVATASPDSLRYQVTFTPYRAPIAASLTVTGLPPSVRWSFNPPTVSGASSSVLELDGVTSLASQGAVNFSVMAGTVAVDGGLITLAVTGSLAFTDAHAYPNPARGQTVHLRLSLTLPPTSLKLRLYDLSGARVLEVSESAPFSAFTTVSATDYEYAWTGANGAGHGVASEKYIYWVEAGNGSTTVTTRGLFTFMRR